MNPTPQDYLSAKVDADVRNALVVHHKGLVYLIAKACYRAPLPELDDLMQVGYLGVIRALKTFEPERGVQFSSYASWWIRNYVSMYVRRNHAAVAGMSRQCEMEIERDIEQAIGAKRETCERRLAATRRAVSLDAPLFDDGDATMVDALPAPDDVDSEVQSRATAQSVRHAIGALGDRDRLIVGQRMREETLQAIGDRLGITRERVRQLEAKARCRMRKAFGGRDGT